eukprot:6020547-Prymnesium_polylepis.1
MHSARALDDSARTLTTADSTERTRSHGPLGRCWPHRQRPRTPSITRIWPPSPRAHPRELALRRRAPRSDEELGHRRLAHKDVDLADPRVAAVGRERDLLRERGLHDALLVDPVVVVRRPLLPAHRLRLLRIERLCEHLLLDHVELLHLPERALEEQRLVAARSRSLGVALGARLHESL